MAVLRNVKVNWASVLKPNTMYEPCWEIEAVLSEEQAAALLEEAKGLDKKGIKFKVNEQGEKTFRFRRKVNRADGNGENKAPKVVGPDGVTEFTQLIGNGSTCHIQYSFIPYKNKFGTGVTNDLKGVMVINHIPFAVQDGDEFAEFAQEGSKSVSKPSSPYDEDGFDDDVDF